MYSVLILVFLICYNLSKGHPPKSTFLEVLGALWRKQCILYSWSTLYIAVSKCKVRGFWFFCFDLSTFTKSVCIKGIFYWGLFLRILVQHQLLKFYMLYSFILEISFAPSRKKRCYFSHGPSCTLYFQGIVCPQSCFLMLIYHYPNSMSKTDSFKTFFICDAPYK